MKIKPEIVDFGRGIYSASDLTAKVKKNLRTERNNRIKSKERAGLI